MKNISNKILKEIDNNSSDWEQRKKFLQSMYDKIKEHWSSVMEYEMPYDYYIVPEDMELEICVEWGDWKHDHLLLDHIAEEQTHPIDMDVQTTEENGSDTYSANHYYYYAPLKKESAPVRKPEKNLSKAILEATDEEYERYMAQEKELADEYYKRLCADITDERRAKFDELKALINNDGEKELIDGFWIPKEFIYAVTDAGKGHHLNPYMDLTVIDNYFLVYENDTIEQALESLFKEYKADSAYSWGDNFLYALDKANPNAYNEFVDEQTEWEDDEIDNDEDLEESVNYEEVESKVVKDIWSALSGMDGVKDIEVLSGAPQAANNVDSKASVKFKLDGKTYVAFIMQLDSDDVVNM